MIEGTFENLCLNFMHHDVHRGLVELHCRLCVCVCVCVRVCVFVCVYMCICI